MYKRFTAVVGVIIMLVVLVTTSHPAAVSADAYTSTTQFSSQCLRNTLGTWDWVTAVKTVSTSNVNFTGFDHDAGSYFLFQNANTNVGPYTQDAGSNFELIIPTDSTAKLEFYQDPTTNAPMVKSTNGTVEQYAAIRDTPVQYYHSYGTAVSGGNTLSNANITPYHGDGSSTPTAADGVVTCVAAAHNVQYDPSFNYQMLQTEQAVGSGNGTTVDCKVTDIACQMKKVIDSVGNVFGSFGQDMLKVFLTVFQPDTVKMRADFDSFNTFMHNKLGFLLYPFDFVVKFFNAYSNSSGYCSSSSCVLDTGNFMGSDFKIDFLSLQELFPTYWTLVINLIRGTTVMSLIFALRYAYQRTTDR